MPPLSRGRVPSDSMSLKSDWSVPRTWPCPYPLIGKEQRVGAGSAAGDPWEGKDSWSLHQWCLARLIRQSVVTKVKGEGARYLMVTKVKQRPKYPGSTCDHWNLVASICGSCVLRYVGEQCLLSCLEPGILGPRVLSCSFRHFGPCSWFVQLACSQDRTLLATPKCSPLQPACSNVRKLDRSAGIFVLCSGCSLQMGNLGWGLSQTSGKL